MDIRNTFNVSQEITEIAKEYDKLAEETQNEELKNVYSQFLLKLDEIHSKLLKLGMHSTDDLVERRALNIVSTDDLPSYCQLTVLYEYQNENLALVEAVGSSLHLVPLDKLRYE